MAIASVTPIGTRPLSHRTIVFRCLPIIVARFS
jgi:hypothetical protein